jgi:hypothetical protein
MEVNHIDPSPPVRNPWQSYQMIGVDLTGKTTEGEQYS